MRAGLDGAGGGAEGVLEGEAPKDTRGRLERHDVLHGMSSSPLHANPLLPAGCLQGRHHRYPWRTRQAGCAAGGWACSAQSLFPLAHLLEAAREAAPATAVKMLGGMER